MMNTLLGSMRRRLGWLPLLVVGLASSGAAFADTYNIFLKPPGSTTPATCATGSFNFTKTVAGTFPNIPASVALTGNCLGIGNGTFGATLSVVVENVTIGGQSQGPSVVGLSGTLTQGGNNPSTITFSYTPGSASTANPTRPTAYTNQNGNNTTTTVGTYHMVNTLNVPEPSGLWLALAALGALFVVARRTRRHA